MGNTAIQVEGLGKRYRIGQLQSYKALRDTLTDAMAAPFRAASSIVRGGRRSRSGQESNNSIWAVKDVSFEINHGEVVGIIGRNGAGKSTLLKLLSRITEPTLGSATIHGRVGCLLEVGTGFHPELTGRENTYLNGAILGMKKAEIDRNFDEIVAFAEVEKFIDTPVKHYSSGMYLRLAFAVAAHLELLDVLGQVARRHAHVDVLVPGQGVELLDPGLHVVLRDPFALGDRRQVDLVDHAAVVLQRSGRDVQAQRHLRRRDGQPEPPLHHDLRLGRPHPGHGGRGVPAGEDVGDARRLRHVVTPPTLRGRRCRAGGGIPRAG